MEEKEAKFEHPTIDNIRNRFDKSMLSLHGTTRPDLFLAPDVALSDQVKHLDIYMSNNTYWDPSKSNEELENVYGVWDDSDEELERYASGYPKSWQFYTRTLCKDIVHLKNLETLNAYDLKLTTDLWLEFIQNNQGLKVVKLYYETVTSKIDIKVVEKLLRLPHLEKVCLWNIPTLYLPPGPSNITELTIDRFYEDDVENEEELPIMMDTWTKNLRTHTKLQKLYISGDIILKNIEPFVDLELTCTQLEEIDVSSRINIEPLTEVLLTFLNLKKLKVNGKVRYPIGERMRMVPIIKELADRQLPMEDTEYEKYKKTPYLYKAPRTLKEAKLRPDKSFYYISGAIQPHLFLDSTVSFPEQVKHLIIDLDNDGLSWEGQWCVEMEEIKGTWSYSEDYYDKHSVQPYQYYTSTLCKDIVNFKNLETFKCHDLKLSTDLWIQFAKNCTCLKELSITCNGISNLESEGVEHLLSIPTLEKIELVLDMPTFPSGPSNIAELTIKTSDEDWPDYEDEDNTFMDAWTKNLRTHTKLKKLHLISSNYTIKNLEPFVDLGLTCTQLEDIKINQHSKDLDLKPLIKVLLTIPSLRKLVVDNKNIIVNQHPYNCGCRRFMVKVQQKLSSEKLYTTGEINDLLEQLMAE